MKTTKAMNPTLPNYFSRSRACLHQRGFTLVEMLVVMVIIAILVAVIGVSVGAAMKAAKNAQAKSDLNKIVNATQAFYTDQQKYPVDPSYQGQQVTFGEDVPYTSQLMDVLRADYQGWDSPSGDNLNPKQIVYVQWPYINAPNPPGAIGSSGQPYDPWGRTYIVRVDCTYNNSVANPYTADAGSNPLPYGVIAWSFGADSQGGEGDKNVGTSLDDVLSWQ